MPRRRRKTELDRARPSPLAVSDLDLVVAKDGAELRQLVTRYGLANVQRVLEALADLARRELIERRSSEVLDAWKTNVRPLASARVPHLPTVVDGPRRKVNSYRHREERMDAVIREQARARQLEDGLAVILAGKIDEWERRQLVEIVERSNEGQSAEQIATATGLSDATIERRLMKLREAAISAEEKELARAS